jgi:hypothetical protein
VQCPLLTPANSVAIEPKTSGLPRSLHLEKQAEVGCSGYLLVFFVFRVVWKLSKVADSR